jgi:hypothetical protein
VATAVAAYQDELKQLRKQRRAEQPKGGVTSAVARKDKEIEQLRKMVKSGAMDPAVLQPAIEAAERARQQLLARDAVREDASAANVVRLMPDAANSYKGTVQRLADSADVLTDVEFAEARAMVFELLRGSEPVTQRADGAAVLTLNLDPAPTKIACGSKAYNLVAGARFGTYFRLRPLRIRLR